MPKLLSSLLPPSSSLQAEGGSYPTASSFSYKLALDQPATLYNLSLCPSQVRQGEWALAVYNPMPSMPLAYNLTVHKVGRCLHNCSDKGRWVAVAHSAMHFWPRRRSTFGRSWGV